MLASADYRLLDSRQAMPGEPSTGLADQPEGQRGRAICCLACRSRVTDASARIEVAGRHEHTFFNPAGLVFHVAAFSAADGCRGVGPFSEEFSWFPGQRWQVAVCAACAEHLGWHFDGSDRFTLLIVQRIWCDDEN